MLARQDHPDWTLRQTASKIGRRHGFARKWISCYEQRGTVAGQPRSGRPAKMNAEATQHALVAAQQQHCKTASTIAAELQQQSGLKISPRSVRRSLRKEGLSHLRPKIVPILTPKHKVTRLSFAKKALRSEQVSWRRVMIRDSNIFRLSAIGRPAGRWCIRATRGTVGRPKHSDGVHAYMGRGGPPPSSL